MEIVLLTQSQLLNLQLLHQKNYKAIVNVSPGLMMSLNLKSPRKGMINDIDAILIVQKIKINIFIVLSKGVVQNFDHFYRFVICYQYMYNSINHRLTKTFSFLSLEWQYSAYSRLCDISDPRYYYMARKLIHYWKTVLILAAIAIFNHFLEL